MDSIYCRLVFHLFFRLSLQKVYFIQRNKMPSSSVFIICLCIHPNALVSSICLVAVFMVCCYSSSGSSGLYMLVCCKSAAKNKGEQQKKILCITKTTIGMYDEEHHKRNISKRKKRMRVAKENARILRYLQNIWL